jgi:light-independent protochlorophyllide reductase subunit B
MGFEGANVLFDTWVQPLMMGLEEHLLHMFKGDFEFHEDAAPSHLTRNQPAAASVVAPEPAEAAIPAHVAAVVAAPIAAPVAALQAIADPAPLPAPEALVATVLQPTATPLPHTMPTTGAQPIVVARWAPDAERELGKIPFFVRGKARRNTERYALDQGLPLITLETLYDAKAHFSR